MSAAVKPEVPAFLARTYAASGPEAQEKMYDEWAKTYDSDVLGASVDYVGPAMTTQAVLAAGGNMKGKILDAGCGTGLAGVALAQAGATHIDGIDLSPGMLDIARGTGVYKDLSPADMTKPLKQHDETYDVITCVGTFVMGHVGPSPALQELVRVAKKGGLVVSTIVEDIWAPGGYEAEVERLGATGAVNVVSTELVDYRRGMGKQARMVILKRT